MIDSAPQNWCDPERLGKAGTGEHGQEVEKTEQMMRPSPFVASVVPDKVFDAGHHVAFGDVFLERHMSPVEDEIEAITRGAGMPDRGDQGWIGLVGESVLEVARIRLAGAANDPGPGTGLCGVRVEDLSDEPVDLYAGTGRLWIGLPRIAGQGALSRLCSMA